MVRAAIPSLPRPCPVTPPKSGAPRAPHALPPGAPRTASLSSAASASVGRRSSPFVAVVARPRPVGPHLRGPLRSARAPPFASASAPGGGRRRCAPPPALGRALRPAPSRLRPARAGFCPGPCPRSPPATPAGAPPASLPCCRCSIIEPALDKCKTIPTSNNLRNFLVMLILFHLFVP